MLGEKFWIKPRIGRIKDFGIGFTWLTNGLIRAI
jgi:hypothetical protein